MEDERSRFALFDGKNYDNWRFRMELYLEEKGVLELVKDGVVELSKPFLVTDADNAQLRKRKEEGLAGVKKKDVVCRNCIVSKLDNSQLEYVKGKTTALDMWRVLETRFAKMTPASRVNLIDKFYGLRFDISTLETFEDFCLRFDVVLRELRQAGDPIDELGAVVQFFRSLPSEYESVMAALQSQDPATLTMESIRLRVEEFDATRRRTRSEESTRGGSKRQKTESHDTPSTAFSGHHGSLRDKSNAHCHNCNGIGHYRKECWSEGGGAYRGGRGRGRGRGGRGGRGGWNNRGGRGYRGGRGFRGGKSGWSNGSRSGAHAAYESEESEREAPARTEKKKRKKESASVAYAFLTSIEEELKQVQVEHLLYSKSDRAMSIRVAPDEAIYLLDSGATNHLVRPDTNVINRKKLDTPIKIHIAKSTVFLIAYEKGEVKTEALVSGQRKPFLLRECLIVEDLKHNLVSISRLESNGNAILFWNSKCFVFDGFVGNPVAAVGIRDQNLLAER